MPILTTLGIGSALGTLASLTQIKLKRFVTEYQSQTSNNTLPPEKHADSIMLLDDQDGIIIMDSLTQIAGISPSIARRLNEAGILTYAELSRAAATDLVALVDTDSVSMDQANQWVMEAWRLKTKMNEANTNE